MGSCYAKKVVDTALSEIGYQADGKYNKYAEELDDSLDDMSYAYHKGLKEIHSLRYEEFISLNSKMIQNNIKEIERLNKLILTQQQIIDNLQNRLDKLEK